MTVRFPQVGLKGLGIGLDLPWGGRVGFGAGSPEDSLSSATKAFFASSARQWSHAFFSWQPRDRSPPELEEYAPAWDDLRASLPPELPLALHHTALNLGSLGPSDRRGLLRFTRALCERYHLQWVNEDVGLWSLAGRALPYPLPPLLTDEGLEATIENVRECQQALPVPLVLEFPGFAQGSNVVCGRLHAYDFFRALAEETAAPVTLDVGHLLSWQWWRGRRGEALFEELDRLPLAHCFELHLSGCQIEGPHFIDAHHGQLLEEQLVLAKILLSRCENLRAVTFEDPRFDDAGLLVETNRPSWQRLVALTQAWLAGLPL